MELKNYFNSHENVLTLLLIVVILLSAYVIGRLLRRLILNLSNKKRLDSKPFTRAFMGSIARKATLFLITLVFLIGKRFFEIPDAIENLVQIISRLLATLSIGLWIYYLVEIPGMWFDSITSREEGAGGKMLSPILKFLSSIACKMPSFIC